MFFFGLFCLHLHPSPLSPFLVFSPLPNSSQWTQWPCLQDPVCPHFCAQIRTGEILVFDQQVPVGSGRQGLPDCGLGAHGCLLCAVRPQRGGQRSGAAFRACRQAPSGLARGQSSPSPHSSKAVMSRARWGLWELQEQVQGSLGLGRLPGGRPRGWTLLSDPVDEVGGPFGAHLPPPSPVPYQGFLSARLTSC